MEKEAHEYVRIRSQDQKDFIVPLEVLLECPFFKRMLEGPLKESGVKILGVAPKPK